MPTNYESYIGKTIENRYTIVNIVGVGGMAIVFGAYDCVSGRSVAIKLLRNDLEDSEISMRQFVNESKALSMLSHPNIVKIYTTHTAERMKYFVMEYVEGITLKTFMNEKGVLGYRTVLYYATQILRALSEIHSKGIVHSDIKPHNVMLISNGHIKVTDFGISRLPDSEPIQKKDTAVGTVYYVSPEQASGKELTYASDIYSLGVMMYEMLTGELPFYDDDPTVVAGMHLSNTPRPPRKINPKIPLGVEQIILKAMSKYPSHRFSSAEEMLNDISQVMNNASTVFDYGSDYKDLKAQAKKNETGSWLSSLFGVATAFLVATVASVIALAVSISNGGYYYIEVPDLKNKAYYSATASGLDERFYNIEVEYRYSSTVPPGSVISQSPAPGAKAKVNTDDPHCNISLVISRGSVMNDYSALNADEVEAELTSLGFKVLKVPEHSDLYRKDAVIKTSPEVGESIDKGATITLYVSLGKALN